MATFVLSGGNAAEGFDMTMWGPWTIISVLSDPGTTASGGASMVTFDNGVVTMVAQGSFGSFDGDNFPHSGTITQIAYTWSPNGVPVTLTISGLSIPVASLLTWAVNEDYAALENAVIHGADTVIGSDAPEGLTGGRGVDTINGGGGDDRIRVWAGEGPDIIDGGAGEDFLELELTNIFFPGPTEDFTFSLPDMASSEGATLVDGTVVRNVELVQIKAGSGDDTFIIGGAIDYNPFVLLHGGEGMDTLVADLSASTDAIGYSPSAPHMEGMFLGHRIQDIEIYQVWSGSGDDTLRGAAHDDTLSAGAGNDRLVGGAGNDMLDGGTGIDTAELHVLRSSATWWRNPDGSWSVDTGAQGVDTLRNVEILEFAVSPLVVLDNAQQTFSGDGTSDILWRRADGLVSIWSMSGATMAGAVTRGGIGNGLTIAGTGDFSGDGRDDIVWRAANGAVSLRGDGGWTDTFVANVGLVWGLAGVGDFNFDGKDDFLWRNTSTGQVAVWTMNGAAALQQKVLTGAPMNWEIKAVADFDGDGRDDIMFRNSANGQLSMWETDGSALTSATSRAGSGLAWDIVGAGDFNGDGRADLLWTNAAGQLAIWHMDGTTTLSSGVIGGVGATWRVEDVGDYNGDGRDDILFRSDGGLVAVWMMNGLTVQSTGVTGSVGAEWEIV